MPDLASRADIVLDLQNFVTLLWEEIEHRDGADAASFWAEDGLFDSKIVCFRGRAEIREWFAWRKGQNRTARHLLTNWYFDFAAWDPERVISARAIMTHFGEFGRGVVPIGPPIGIYDHSLRARQGGERGWTILELVNDPVFLKEDHVAKQYTGPGGQAGMSKGQDA